MTLTVEMIFSSPSYRVRNNQSFCRPIRLSSAVGFRDLRGQNECKDWRWMCKANWKGHSGFRDLAVGI